MRRRGYISPYVKAVLSEAFSINMFPDKDNRVLLGQKTGLDPRQVQIWFQNARSKRKRARAGMAGSFNNSY